MRFVQWWMTVLGGLLLGGGCVLHAQVALALHSREEVESVFFLWRGVGQLTFMFQDDETQLALWLHEVPRRFLIESDRAAWTLVVLGGALAIGALFVQAHPKQVGSRQSASRQAASKQAHRKSGAKPRAGRR